MAQPLAKSDSDATSSIETAAERLELAFARLEGAARNAAQGHHSLKADEEKLNLLLQEAEQKIAALKEVTSTVSTRLDRTISVLEKMEE